LAVGCLLLLYRENLSGAVAIVGIVATAAVLGAEHWLAERVNLAFFQLNIVVGFLVFGSVWAGTQGW
jgi:4-hydroxybenzoate polyprenyltransferase